MIGPFAERLSLRPGLGAALLAVLVCGCDASGQYAPNADSARVAVETALSAWREGRSIDDAQADPNVRVVDSAWSEKQALESFEVLHEEAGDDGTRLVTVQLKLKKPQADREVVYVVHGREPTWVYLEDDYRRMLNMDDNPVKSRSRASRRTKGN